MRTNIDIDDALMAETIRVTGQSTKKGAVEEAMRFFVRVRRQKEAIEKMRGIGWDGDLDATREGWAPRDWGVEEDGR